MQSRDEAHCQRLSRSQRQTTMGCWTLRPWFGFFFPVDGRTRAVVHAIQKLSSTSLDVLGHCAVSELPQCFHATRQRRDSTREVQVFFKVTELGQCPRATENAERPTLSADCCLETSPAYCNKYIPPRAIQSFSLALLNQSPRAAILPFRFVLCTTWSKFMSLDEALPITATTNRKSLPRYNICYYIHA